MPDLEVCEDASAWDAFVAQASDGSPLQAWAWGSLKSRYGWTVRRYALREGGTMAAGVSVLRRSLPGGLALHYAPRGPVLDGRLDLWPPLWEALRARLSRDGGTVLKLDPQWSTDPERDVLLASGGRESRHPIQHQATMVVDIRGGDAALGRFKESTRRNVRAGERRGISVEASDASAAMEHFYGLLRQTGVRRSFPIRPHSYYQDLLSLFRERGQASVYLARLDGRLLAGAVMIFLGRTLAYLFGATADEAEEHKPGYLLHWRAIQDAQTRGCSRYDMWGVPLDPQPSHPGFGYYTFKSRFNGEQVRFIGLFDLPVHRAAAFTLRFAERFARAGQPEFV